MSAGWQFKWKYVGIWALVCIVSAVPSFCLGLSIGNKAAMVAGIFLFIAGYVTLASSPLHGWLKMHPRAYRSFRFGYYLRLLFSLWMLVSLVIHRFPMTPLLLDGVSGTVALSIVHSPGQRRDRHERQRCESCAAFLRDDIGDDHSAGNFSEYHRFRRDAAGFCNAVAQGGPHSCPLAGASIIASLAYILHRPAGKDMKL